MNTGWRLILRSAIQFAAGGSLTIFIEALARLILGEGMSAEAIALVGMFNTFLVIVLQNLAENYGIEWASPVKRPDKV